MPIFPRRKPQFRDLSLLLLAAGSLLWLAGCSHRAQTASAPPPPPIAPLPQGPQIARREPPSEPSTEKPSAAHSEDEEFVATHTPIYSEEGMASWYGPPYHQRRAANGQIYDEHQLSAANRTLPMGSLIRVTNLATGQSAIMRITDRGPFVPGRILDLSLEAAKETGVWRPGVARVRVDVYATPRPIDGGGRWCVQVGAFHSEKEARQLQEKLERKYHTANVIEFTGPTGHWVRIRPANDDHARAVEIAKNLRPADAEAYLVRLD